MKNLTAFQVFNKKYAITFGNCKDKWITSAKKLFASFLTSAAYLGLIVKSIAKPVGAVFRLPGNFHCYLNNGSVHNLTKKA